MAEFLARYAPIVRDDTDIVYTDDQNFDCKSREVTNNGTISISGIKWDREPRLAKEPLYETPAIGFDGEYIAGGNTGFFVKLNYTEIVFFNHRTEPVDRLGVRMRVISRGKLLLALYNNISVDNEGGDEDGTLYYGTSINWQTNRQKLRGSFPFFVPEDSQVLNKLQFRIDTGNTRFTDQEI